VKHRVEMILKQLGAEVAGPLEDLLPIIRVGIEETHRIQMNLRPSLLDSLGILATVDWFVKEFRKAYPAIDIRAKVDLEEADVLNPVKTVIYRVMQEALNNVARHSKAGLVDISLKKEGNQVEFTIEDHG